MNIKRMKRILAALQPTKRETRVLTRMSRNYARFQTEEAKIAAGTHRRIDDERPFRRKKLGKSKAKNDHVWRIPKAERPRCGARCRDGHACLTRAVLGRKRCRMHGGASTGPRTLEGRARIAESNIRRAAEGATSPREKWCDKVPK